MPIPLPKWSSTAYCGRQLHHRVLDPPPEPYSTVYPSSEISSLISSSEMRDLS
jgi:hypothetical protein